MPTSLPPSAQARQARFARTRARSSLLSVPSAAALAAVGMDPVGDVLGASVRQLSRAIGMMSGYRYGSATASPIRLSGDRWSPFHDYARTLDGGYAEVLGRLEAEARALGADGVVGLQLTRTHFENLHEFLAVGTAVRMRSTARPGRPFTTDLSGPDVAALLLAGWVPVGLRFAVEIGVRADDRTTVNQLSRGNRANVEIGAYTELMTRVRAAARRRFADRVRQSGADGALLGATEVRRWDDGGAEAVEAVLVGTGIARFARRPDAPRTGLAVLPLTPARTAR